VLQTGAGVCFYLVSLLIVLVASQVHQATVLSIIPVNMGQSPAGLPALSWGKDVHHMAECDDDALHRLVGDSRGCNKPLMPYC